MTNLNQVFTRKTLIHSLIENKALLNGQLNDDGVDVFILKFHEQLPKTQRLVIEE